MGKQKNARVVRLIRAAKKALESSPPTTDGINWRRSAPWSELDDAVRAAEKFTRLRGRR